METVIAALISAGVTLAVCIVTQAISASRTRALLEYRMGQLEKKVDRHNRLIERTYDLEGEVRVLKAKMGGDRL